MPDTPEVQYPSLIYKQVLEVTDEQTVDLQNTAEILSIQMQNGQLCVWYKWYAHPDNINKRYPWTFRIIGTGHEFDDIGLSHLASVQDGPFVWHVFKKYN